MRQGKREKRGTGYGMTQHQHAGGQWMRSGLPGLSSSSRPTDQAARQVKIAETILHSPWKCLSLNWLASISQHPIHVHIKQRRGQNDSSFSESLMTSNPSDKPVTPLDNTIFLPLVSKISTPFLSFRHQRCRE